MESDSIVLQGDNYDCWSASVECRLKKEDLWSVVISPESSRQEDDKDWKAKNFKALQVICNSCGRKAFFKIREVNLAKKAWDILANEYALPDSITAGLYLPFPVINHFVRTTQLKFTLDSENFVQWRARLKSYLVARDLWSVVVFGQEDSEVASKNWKEKNFEALKAIRNLCGCEALSEIKGAKSAQDAWNTLVEKYDGVDTDNYAHWRNRVKSNLVGQGLWNIIESTDEPPKQENDEDWKNNSKALDMIRSSCGWKTFSDINETCPAKIVWDRLADRFDKQIRIKKEILEGRSLVVALENGNWKGVEEFLTQNPSLMSAKITCWKETAVHIAVAAGKQDIVDNLVKQMSPEDLETLDYENYTALAQAVIRGKLEMTECMLKRNKDLVHIEGANQRLPVVLAIEYMHKDLALHLYHCTSLNFLTQDKGIHGATVCTQAIYNGMLDIALDLIRKHRPFALAIDLDGCSPVYALASTYAVFKGSRPGFCKRWICERYCSNFCSVNRSDEQSRSTLPQVNVEIGQIQTGGSAFVANQREEERANGSGSSLRKLRFAVPALQHQLVSSLRKLLDVCSEEKKFDQAQKLLHLMSEQIAISTEEDLDNGRVFSSVNLATREGMSDFLSEILATNDGLKWTIDREGRNIFSNAVRHRQAKIYKKMCDSPEKEVMIKSLDFGKNNILHMAGMLAPATQLDRISGAAFQMQYELRWFKEVESIVPSTLLKAKNDANLTPKELFAEQHYQLREKGEQWMKDTATSCTVVGALIITIMFAAAFTVPGGYNQETGLPMFLNEKLFKVFMVCDSISLVSSSTSVLIFLAILTSRYAEKDFLRSLPIKMIMGLSTLFLSIAAMMIAFCAALVLMLRGQASIFISTISLAGLPVALFVLMQSRLLFDVIKSILVSNIG